MHFVDNLEKGDTIRDICTDNTGVFHPFLISFSNPVSYADGSGDMCDPVESGTEMDIVPNCRQITIPSAESTRNEWKTKWKIGGNGWKWGTQAGTQHPKVLYRIKN